MGLLKKEFRDFVKDAKSDLDTETIIQILTSHGKVNECIKFAEETGSYKELIIHFINKGDFREALRKLEKIQDKKVACK